MSEIKKTLYRIPKQAKIAGVCAGLAEYFEIDVTVVRILYIVLALATGGGGFVILYIVLAFVLPVDHGVVADTISEKAEALGRELSSKKSINRMRNYIGIGLLIFGAWLLAGQYFPEIFSLRWQYIWPLILIATGLLVLFKKSK